jgi:trimeric autotransporter adhesin
MPMCAPSVLFATVVAAAVVCSGFTSQAAAQCARWLPGPMGEVVQGTDGFIGCAVLWDPDGAGPLPTYTVVGGQFSAVGGVPARNLAAWDGQRWQPLGAGTDGFVRALAVHQNDLYVGGEFASIGPLQTRNIAKLRNGPGGTWEALGSGLYLNGFGDSQAVDALCVFNNQIYAGGTFAYRDANQSNRGSLAAWNGAAWSTPSGLRPALDNGDSLPVVVRTLTVYNNELVAGGGFALQSAGPPINLAAFNGASWRALGGPAARRNDRWPVFVSTTHGGDLVIAGDIVSVAGVPVNRIAAWNGSSWRALGTGIEVPYSVRSLGSFQGQLIVGGAIPSAGGVPVSNLAAWNGSAWSSYAGGVGADNFFATVYALLPMPDGLLVGGSFDTAGVRDANLRTPALSLARWTGAAWNRYEGAASIFSMASLGGTAIGGGSFAGLDSAGDRVAHLVRWDGALTSALGSGVNGPVRALKSFSPDPLTRNLVVGGEFTMAGGLSAARIAQWTESDILGTREWNTMGTGFNLPVRAIERFNNVIYASGDFTASGDNATAYNRVARWDSINRRWLALSGTDLNGPCYALKVFNGSLYAGGAFTSANGQASGGLARWNGSSWSIVGGFFLGTVHALEVFRGELVISGQFAGLPGSPNVARYNGVSYAAMTGGTNDIVRALAVGPDGNLYLAGDFTQAGGAPASRVAMWTGSAWANVNGVDGPVHALLAHRAEVQVGGAFANTLAPAQRSTGWARFNPTGAPWVASGPVRSGPACTGGIVAFDVTPAAGYAVTYQWRRNGVAIAAGRMAGGTFAAGVTTARLTLSEVRAADNGTLTCLITNACGSIESPAVGLSTCGPDVNCDGFIDFFDYDEFVAAFESGAPVRIADYNGDGFIDFFDYADFVAAFEAGC